MKVFLSSIAAAAVLPALAQLGATDSVIAEAVSNVHTNYSYKKDIIKETEDGLLKDRQGKLASVADASAQAETAERVGRIASAWKQGFSNGVEQLSAQLQNIPKTGRFIELRFPLLPQTSRKLDIYVASNHYNSVANEDVMYIYFGQDFANAPTITVPYVWESGFTTNRVAGTWTKRGTSDHWTNTYDIVLSRNSSADIHYTCHRLHVQRPAALKGIPCNLNPHGTWGSDQGIAFGSLLVNVEIGGTSYPTYTGQVTNETEGVIAIFDNGAFMGLVPIAQQQGESEQ